MTTIELISTGIAGTALIFAWLAHPFLFAITGTTKLCEDFKKSFNAVPGRGELQVVEVS